MPIAAPDFLCELDGLESNRINQLVVTDRLQTTRDPSIFAFGDCAACPWPEKKGWVPPRAQSGREEQLAAERAKKASIQVPLT